MKDEDEHAHVRCRYCKELVYIHDAKEVVKNLAQGKTITMHFCNDNCHSEFYLERLRGCGL